MHYLVALGNPGVEYKRTRHNVGFAALDFMVASLGLAAPKKSKEYDGQVVEATLNGQAVILLYPDTFMNHSGRAVKKLLSKKDAKQLIVIYDEIALPLGEIKLSFGRGDGGHNGIKSIIAALGTKDFVRVRIGVGPTTFWTGKLKPVIGAQRSRFVLGRFTKREESKLEEVFKTVQAAVLTIIEEGYTKAMDTYN